MQYILLIYLIKCFLNWVSRTSGAMKRSQIPDHLPSKCSGAASATTGTQPGGSPMPNRIPSLTVYSPQPNAVVGLTPFTVTGLVTAPGMPEPVGIDDVLVQVDSQPPVTATLKHIVNPKHL